MGEPKLESWMVKWVKREAQSSGSAGRKAWEETWSQIAAAIEAALATPEREELEVLRELVPRVKRARSILSEHGNWGMLNTSRADAILASTEADDAD